MSVVNFQKATFLRSAAQMQQLPPDQGIEVAIVGRSNAGKSSVLNMLTQQKHLGRVSKTPGRTQLINIFTLDAQRRLIDLPGYGYAKVPAAVKERWEKTLDAYIQTRQCLRGLVLVMDIRHPLQPLDEVLLEFCLSKKLNVHVLLNKCDKLSNAAAKATLQKVSAIFAEYANTVSVQMFSAMKGTGKLQLVEQLNLWYQL